jgi:hypothetical protein
MSEKKNIERLKDGLSRTKYVKDAIQDTNISLLILLSKMNELSNKLFEKRINKTGEVNNIIDDIIKMINIIGNIETNPIIN